MNQAITLDLPMLIVGLALVLWARLRAPRYVFHVMCELVSTFAGQLLTGVAVSLGRLVPILALTAPARRPAPGAVRAFVPFFFYAIVATLLFSQRWNIPPGVAPFYGEYRFVVQLLTFVSLALPVTALAEGVRHPKAIVLLSDGFTAVNILHGLASMYQLAAESLGLPVIGIARISQQVDIAAFMTESGQKIMRPGGLAGEPKTAAVLFGAYLLVRTFGMPPRPASRKRRFFETLALVLASASFLVTWSTSAFIGISVAALVLFIRFPTSLPKTVSRLVLVSALAFGGWMATQGREGVSFDTAVRERTADRVDARSSAQDPPVAAALDAIENDLSIAMFGTGLGGSSFIAMKFMGTTAFAYSPNVMIVLLLCELGLVGTLLLLLPCGALAIRPLPPSTHPTYASARFCLVLGIGTLILQLVGSGIAMGFTLAIGALAGSAALTTLGFAGKEVE